MNKYKILGFGFLAVVAAIVVGAVYVWQNPKQAQAPIQKDKTADWKTYTNAQYGFEFRYPADWAYDGTSEVYFDKVDPATGKRKYSEGTGGFSFSILNASVNSEYTKTRDNCQSYGTIFKIADPIFSYQEITLAGKNGFQVNCNSEYGNPYTVTILPITASMIIKINSGYKSTLHNQILSTFKFTDSADTSTWKTYSNTQYGYEIKYPEGWTIVDGKTEPISFGITGPAHYDIPGANKYGASYIVWVYLSEGKLIINNAYEPVGFFVNLKSDMPMQEPDSLRLSESYIKSSADYKIFQQILSTFKFTK